MHLRFCLSLLVGLVALVNAAAQSNASGPNPVAFRMIRATVEFLATDTKAFGSRATIPCSPCETYTDLNQYATKNHLLGADKLIIDARNEANRALQTDSTQMPATLRSFLLNRVTDGSHGYRTSLPAYDAYARSLNAEAGTTTEPSAAPATVPESGDLAPLDGTPDTADTGTEASPDNLTDQPTNAFSLMDYLPIILSVLSLAGVIVLWFRKPAAPAQPTILPDDKIKNLTDRVRELEKDNRQLKENLMTIRQTVDTPRPPAPQPQPTNRPVTPAAPVPPTRPTPQPIPQKPAPPAPAAPQPAAPTVLFGRTADLGDGFSAHNLSDKPDRDTVFEILRIDPTRAEFKVSDNPDLQRLALSDAYSYLNDTCAYTTQPRPGNRIRTEKPGLLSLQGEKWVIVEKAQISFLG